MVVKRIVLILSAVLCAALSGAQNTIVSGVVSGAARDSFDPAWLWVSVRTDEGSVPVGCWDRERSLEDLRALIDAEVAFACEKKRFEFWRCSDRFYYAMTAAPRLLKRPPENPFQTSVLTDDPTPNRQRHTGLVLLVGQRRFFMTGPGFSVLTVFPQDDEPMPETGDTVNVAGFLDNGTFANMLTEAKVRVKTDVPQQPIKVTTIRNDQLIVDKRKPLHIPHEHRYGKLIRIVGVVVRTAADASQPGRVTLNCGDIDVSVDLSDLTPSVLESIPVGCTLEVSGLCLFEFSADDPVLPIPRFRCMTIIPGSKDGLRILRNPPWWTPFRLLAVIGSLALLLVAVFVWNVALRRLVDRRSREALRAQIDSVASELRIEERTRLAVELHDSISQNLSGASMQVNAAEVFLSKNPVRTRDCLRAASDTIDSCREELRNCILDLRNHALEEPTVEAAIRKTLQPHLCGTELALRFNAPRAKISDNTLHALLRIIRELVMNAIRHGHATAVSVAGAIEGDRLLFSVGDNGCGFDHEHHPGPAEGHFGLQGIKERIQRFGGEMRIEDRVGGGTRVKLWIRSKC